MSKEYKVIQITCSPQQNPVEELERLLNQWYSDGYKLLKLIPITNSTNTKKIILVGQKNVNKR